MTIVLYLLQLCNLRLHDHQVILADPQKDCWGWVGLKQLVLMEYTISKIWNDN